PGGDHYRRGRRALLRGDVNLIATALLRAGERPPMYGPWPASPYALLVARAGLPDRCTVWPAHYRRPLPVIPVPLSPPDADLSLDLQPMIAGIYERSRYAY